MLFALIEDWTPIAELPESVYLLGMLELIKIELARVLTPAGGIIFPHEIEHC